MLNFPVLKYIVDYTKERISNGLNKNVEFVVCTNLTLLTQSHLDYFVANDVVISTSFDGPEDCHDANRILRNGQSSYQVFKEKLESISDHGVRNTVSALLTVTRQNINRLSDVVDEYVATGFNGIFIRILNRIGFAANCWDGIGYSVDDFITSYRKTLAYIIELNIKGTFFPEVLATILLTKIMTPFSTGFVDLQSPAGVGIAGVIYDANGDVFVSDEGRMVARATGDDAFKIGNVQTDSWGSIFSSSKLRSIVSDTVIESLPTCCYCAYQPYCGTDPVRNYIANGRIDIICKDSCKKYSAIFDTLFGYLNTNNREIHDVFWSWITGKKN